MKSSPATEAWDRWRRGQGLKRRLAAWSGTSGLALVVLGLVAWGGFLAPINVGEKGESLSVKLGNPDGEDLPLAVSAAPDQAMQAVMAAQREAVQSTVEETRPSEPDPAPAPVPVAKPLPSSKPAPATSPQPVATPAVKSDKAAVTEKVIRGVEKGNASELILKPQGDKISQNAYWPVYLFMPLPAKLDAGLLARVPATQLYSADERRTLLLQFYAKAADGLNLSGEVPLAVRPAVWEILEGAGYDVANADYKRGKNLRPVIIGFGLGVPKETGANPELIDVKLEQSSGSAAVDEAVLHAFRRSSFANGTGKVAQGRYTYDFSSKK